MGPVVEGLGASVVSGDEEVVVSLVSACVVVDVSNTVVDTLPTEDVVSGDEVAVLVSSAGAAKGNTVVGCEYE